jgi:hypothetical protein
MNPAKRRRDVLGFGRGSNSSYSFFSAISSFAASVALFVRSAVVTVGFSAWVPLSRARGAKCRSLLRFATRRLLHRTCRCLRGILQRILLNIKNKVKIKLGLGFSRSFHQRLCSSSTAFLSPYCTFRSIHSE